MNIPYTLIEIVLTTCTVINIPLAFTYRLLDRVKMPSKKGFCWCFGGRAPPEITYGIENGAMTIKQIEMDAPMPQDEEELNAMFAELVVSMLVL